MCTAAAVSAFIRGRCLFGGSAAASAFIRGRCLFGGSAAASAFIRVRCLFGGSAAASAFIRVRCLFGGSAAAPAFIRGRCLFGGAAACSSGNNSSHNPQNKIEIQKQKVPWLMLSSSTKPESRYLYDLLTIGAGGSQLRRGSQLQSQDGDNGMPLIALNREIHLPKIAGHLCIGSSQGFLITVDRNAEIHATNPFTGARLPLPSTATLPNMIGVIRDTVTGYIKYYISSADPESPEIDLLINEDNAGLTSLLLSINHGQIYSLEMGYMRESYYRKLILSPSLDTAVAMHDSALVYGTGRLAFARLGGDDDTSSWTELNSSEVNVNDIILHKGQLHAVDGSGTLSVYDMENPSAQPFCSPEGPLLREGGSLRRTVVESADGDDLFLVFRDLGFEDEPPRTQGFKVFKLDKSDYKWNRVDSVGGLALFVGFTHTMSLSARDFRGLTPNCIYFIDEHPEGLDTGVFNLKDGSIQFFQFFQSTDGLQQLNRSPPVWFMPAMC